MKNPQQTVHINSCFNFTRKEAGWLIGVGNLEFLPKRRFHCTFLLSCLFTEQNIAARRWLGQQNTVVSTSFQVLTAIIQQWYETRILWYHDMMLLYEKIIHCNSLMFTLLLALIIHHYLESWTLQPGYVQVMSHIFKNSFLMSFLLELMTSSKARITALDMGPCNAPQFNFPLTEWKIENWNVQFSFLKFSILFKRLRK